MAPASLTSAAPRLMAPLYASSRPVRRASSVATHVKSRLALRRHRRVAQREALIVPELLDIFCAADAHQLQALEVGAVRQQHIGHVIGFVAREGEAEQYVN